MVAHEEGERRPTIVLVPTGTKTDVWPAAAAGVEEDPFNRYHQQVLLEVPMSDPVFSREVRPITDFKAKGSAIVEQARRTKRPVLITQRGRGVAVVLDLDEYERMQEELAFGRAVDEGAEQARRKEFASAAEVAAVLGRR